MDEKRGPEPSPDFFISSRADSWLNFSYHERHLDAMATIFNVYTSCAAVLYNEDKYYLSFNKSIFRKEIGDKTHKTVDKLLKSIKDAINNGDKDGVLFFYLTYNHDFSSVLRLVYPMGGTSIYWSFLYPLVP